jgi:hypothetical protein
MGIGVSKSRRPGAPVGLIRNSRHRRTFQIQVNLRVRLGPNDKAPQVWKRLLPEPVPKVGQEKAHQGSWVLLFLVVEVARPEWHHGKGCLSKFTTTCGLSNDGICFKSNKP